MRCAYCALRAKGNLWSLFQNTHRRRCITYNKDYRMRFFFSGELDVGIANEYRSISQDLETILNNELSHKSYGVLVETIAVIPMILGPQFIEGRKERRLIKRGEKTADYRLFIDHKAFVSGSLAERRKLLLNNILACVSDIARKCKGGFDGERLTNDIRNLFPELS